MAKTVIHHFDNHSGRFIELHVSDEDMENARRNAQAREQRSLRREATLDTCRSLYANGASLDHVLGKAFNAGHAFGSGQVKMTEKDMRILDIIADLDEQEMFAINAACPPLWQAIKDQKNGEKACEW